MNKDFTFDKIITEPVLRNYLSRSLVYNCLEFSTEQIKKYPECAFDECLKVLIDGGVKYVGRSACSWIPSKKEFSKYDVYKENIKKAHDKDPDIIFEACIFETCYPSFNDFKIPKYVFDAFNLPYEDRCFDYKKMLFSDGLYVDHWEKDGSIPDITNIETQMFFFFRGCFYIDLGFEALHYGQVLLIGKHDNNMECFTKVMNMVRSYAKVNARRHFILLNAHTSGLMGSDGKLLFDFHSFPIRPISDKNDISHPPSKDNPQITFLEVGFGDSIYCKSMGGLTHSGWECESLPYFVEIDNYEMCPFENSLNTPGHDYYPWGYDEVSWFANQSKEYRKRWMLESIKWLQKTDKNGYIEILGSRGFRRYDATTNGVKQDFYRINSIEENDCDILTECFTIQ